MDMNWTNVAKGLHAEAKRLVQLAEDTSNPHWNEKTASEIRTAVFLLNGIAYGILKGTGELEALKASLANASQE